MEGRGGEKEGSGRKGRVGEGAERGGEKEEEGKGERDRRKGRGERGVISDNKNVGPPWR